jgi:hypothetical protein
MWVCSQKIHNMSNSPLLTSRKQSSGAFLIIFLIEISASKIRFLNSCYPLGSPMKIITILFFRINFDELWTMFCIHVPQACEFEWNGCRSYRPPQHKIIFGYKAM